MIIGKGCEQGFLSEQEAVEIIRQAAAGIELRDKKVLVLLPDNTRSGPTGFFYRTLCGVFGPKAKQLDFLITLGTHPALTQEKIYKHLDITEEQCKTVYRKHRIINHLWDKPETFARIGVITADEIHKISGGLFREEVPVELNRIVLEYDLVIIYGPVFPHEVVGFSGGNKYFFPGIAGFRIINFFHWLGAVITNVKINGTKNTPVRDVVERAASFIKTPSLCFAAVVSGDKLKGLFFGETKDAWSAAADLSAKVHIVYKDRRYRKVLGIAPEMYDDIWTAGKVMYKLEPVVEDGGELVIYAPHVAEISYTHGKVLDRIGYHTRDYFLAQMDKFEGVPRGVMAHSTHVKGTGTYENGTEKPRINVILATGIPEYRCSKVNLGYMDPAGINIKAWEGREQEGILVVPHAGETLHRYRA